jgi:hypothetical protein
MPVERNDTEREQGHQRGWGDAEEFIGRHPHRMPWAVSSQPRDAPTNAYEAGYAEGWTRGLLRKGGRDAPLPA